MSTRGRESGRVKLAVVVLAIVAAVVAAVGWLARPSTEQSQAAVRSTSQETAVTVEPEQSSRPHEEATALSAPVSVPGTGQGDTTMESSSAVATALGFEDFSQRELRALSEPLPTGARKVMVPVLMYHYVDEEPPPAGPYADSLTVRTPDFIEQLQYLSAHGYHTVTLAEVYVAMAGLRELPEKPVVLTFDDGGLDNYTVAFPLLREYGFVAVFFVISKRVGAEGQMSWDQLREMAGSGMHIQSHTVSHPDLRDVSDVRLRSEVEDSRRAISEGVGQPGCVLAYPAGSYNARVIEATRAAGYVMAVTTDHGRPVDPQVPFEIRRLRVQAFTSISEFARLVKPR